MRNRFWSCLLILRKKRAVERDHYVTGANLRLRIATSPARRETGRQAPKLNTDRHRSPTPQMTRILNNPPENINEH